MTRKAWDMNAVKLASESALKSGVKRVLGRAGLDIVRSIDNRGTVDEFLPFEPTMRAAKAAGLSVGDYLDEVVNELLGPPRQQSTNCAHSVSSQQTPTRCSDRPWLRTVPGEDA